MLQEKEKTLSEPPKVKVLASLATDISISVFDLPHSYMCLAICVLRVDTIGRKVRREKLLVEPSEAPN